MNDLKNKTILVTGGAGFIGSHLCDKLLELEAKVICLDNLFTGKEENIARNLANENFSFVKSDANKEDDLKKVFREYKFDYVFHYAAVLGVLRVKENPLLVLPDIQGIETICRLAKENGVKKLIFASSSEAYGDMAELPLREDNNVDMARHSQHAHIYALVKLMGERILKVYNDKYGLPTCSLRFFKVFGPRQESSAYGFVTGVFIKQIINNEQPTVFGDGFQTRDFIYIDDNINLAINALFADQSNGQVINIGAGRQTTILDLANKLIAIGNKDLKPKFLPSRENEIKYRSPDITKMQKILEVKITTDLDDNLKKTYEEYLKNA